MRLRSVLALGLFVVSPAWAFGQDAPRVEPVPGEGMQVSEWATHPLVHDPVAIDIDPHGRVYTAETGRQDLGVVDNRSSGFWLLDDLAAQTTADRLAYFQKHAAQREGGMAWYSNWSDLIRRVSDEDGDGIADTVTDFAGPFNDPLDGTGAGVLWRDGAVWYTCIPHLWQLHDADEDGVAESEEELFSGFGVRTALSGHDMHGLVIGPDGRLYWSIGDRGYNVTLPDGTVWKDPHSGAIFRCEQDGSNFEVFAFGLRNPQEIAFNQWGDLFTGDNNSDSVDRARFVYIPQGAEIGWDMAYQTLGGDNERGPWVQEALWQPDHDGRPAWSIPPLANIGAGPSGFAFIDGEAVPEHFRDRLLMCDFRGSPQGSLVHAVKVQRAGAGYEVVDNDPFISKVLTTDIDQDWGGTFLVSDWVIGWDNTKTGRLWRLEPEGGVQAESAATLARVAREGFAQQDIDTLGELLAHPDHRGRTEAHLALARRGDEGLDVLAATLEGHTETLPRIHALWGMWAMARWDDSVAEPAIELIESAAWDDDAEVRAQVARVLGDLGAGGETLSEMLFDESPRVVAFAANGLGNAGTVDDMDAIAEVLWALEDDPDVFVRHAAAMGLAGIGDRERLLELLGDPQPTVRLGALLALRKLRDPAVSTLLRDQDLFIAAEAARAIQDAEIDDAFGDLAAAADAWGADPTAATQSPHEITWSRWPRTVSATADLTDPELIEGDPEETLTLTIADAPVRAGDNFVARMYGTFMPPMDGEYQFVITSDDQSVLLLEIDGEWSKACGMTSWGRYKGWQDKPEQTSDPITLRAGVPIRFDARHREGGGNDFVSIGWIRPDGVMEAPIGGSTGSRAVESIVRRAIEACVRDGSPDRAAAVARVALNQELPEVIRVDALDALASWAHPEPRNRVTGRWRPIDARDVADVRAALGALLPPLAQSHGRVGQTASAAAQSLGVALDPAILQETLADANAPVHRRIDAVRALSVSSDADLARTAIDQAVASSDPALQSAALSLLNDHDPVAATALAMTWSRTPALQRAAVQQLGRAADEASARELAAIRDSISDQDNRLDVLEALVARGTAISEAERYAAALHGGDQAEGERIVRFHASAQCIRCHAFDGVGGIAGPDLSDVGSRLDDSTLLESLLDPQATIAEGFGEASAMPAMQEHLTPLQVRDVVAWLKQRQTKSSGH
ncbi:MAG: HEAT repeat domain-containing protein [Phycisphaerales bacterium]|nr:HEAT repeat domain-containing protein [Phycisphaerales bacterium]